MSGKPGIDGWRPTLLACRDWYRNNGSLFFIRNVLQERRTKAPSTSLDYHRLPRFVPRRSCTTQLDGTGRRSDSTRIHKLAKHQMEYVLRHVRPARIQTLRGRPACVMLLVRSAAQMEVKDLRD